MTESKNERQEKRVSKKQQALAEAKDLHEEYLEDGGSLDFVSDMGCRAHALKVASALGNPSLVEHAVLVTQHRKQVGLEPLDPFKLMLDGTLITRAQQSEEEVEDKILENKATAEKEKLRKDRKNAAGGRISARN